MSIRAQAPVLTVARVIAMGIIEELTLKGECIPIDQTLLAAAMKTVAGGTWRFRVNKPAKHHWFFTDKLIPYIQRFLLPVKV